MIQALLVMDLKAMLGILRSGVSLLVTSKL
jgi:hypothetical protein